MSGRSVAYAAGSMAKTSGTTHAPLEYTVTRGHQTTYYNQGHQTMSWDWPQRNATKTWSGVVKDAGSNPVIGATVDLYREQDNQKVASTTTDGSGHYSFMRDANDPFTYKAEAYTAATTPQIHGMSDRGNAPV